MEGALFVSKKKGEFSKGKLMVKNCMEAIFDTGPFQSGVGAIWKGRLRSSLSCGSASMQSIFSLDKLMRCHSAVLG